MRELPLCRLQRPLDRFSSDLYTDSDAHFYALRVPAHRVRIWRYGEESCKLKYFADVGNLPTNPYLKHLRTYANLVPEGIRLLGQREDGRVERLATWRRALECFKRVNPHMSLSFCEAEQLNTFRTRLRLIQDRAQELVDLAVDVVGIKITRIDAQIRVRLAKERKCKRFRARMEAIIERERRWRERGDLYRSTAMHWDLFWRNGNSPDFEYDEEGPAEWQDEWDEGRLCVSEQAAELFGYFLKWTGD
ncbi:hypothetical protein M3Y99_01372500 [Aphelenchoides fujianensis]|nr:hypothetical protein M3Y99_01372500 [Aphelenchoides fujianensis]